jgi:hypothetical protein
MPRLADHLPTLFAGLSKHFDLRLVSRLESARGRLRCGMGREDSHGSPAPKIQTDREGNIL